MVKVGILTYHRSLNYGAVMQAYCLAEEIQKRFPDVSVEIVDYMSKKMNRYYKMITIYRGKESLIHLKERIEMYKAFQKGWNELPLSDKKIISDNYVFSFTLLNYTCFFKHPFNVYSITYFRLINKYMSYSTNYFIILNYWTSTHTLHYSTCFA